MDPTLQVQSGQQNLTSPQRAEAKRFANAFIQAQLSTEPVDEPQAEAYLRQAYAVAGLAPPQRIHWLDNPLQFLHSLLLETSDTHQVSVWDNTQNSRQPEVAEQIHFVRSRVQEHVAQRVRRGARQTVENVVGRHVWHRLAALRTLVQAAVLNSVSRSTRDTLRVDVAVDAQRGVWAYQCADHLACFGFFDRYLAPNDLHALIHFNQMVSGYWLGLEKALLVRHPHFLCSDARGRFHSESGKCIEYPDGWGCYAWHGVLVPEKAILSPETLTRDDFLNETNVEARRVIQERMGDRFVSELGGVVLDRGPRGTLYEVALPDDPERVARYVQVQDASTPRQYALRVPPTIQTAAEAVAWSFQMTVEEYAPVQET